MNNCIEWIRGSNRSVAWLKFKDLSGIIVEIGVFLAFRNHFGPFLSIKTHFQDTLSACFSWRRSPLEIVILNLIRHEVLVANNLGGFLVLDRVFQHPHVHWLFLDIASLIAIGSKASTIDSHHSVALAVA